MLAPTVRRSIAFSIGVLLPALGAACVGANPPPAAVDSAPRPGGTVVEAVMASQRIAASDSQPRRWGDRYWGTSSPATRVEPVVARSEWAVAHEWSGEGAVKTDSFDVDSEWRLVWRSGNRPVDQPLKIEAYREGADELVARIIVDGQSPASSLHLRGKGSYYLTVNGAGGGWYVGVELPGRD